jgi:CHRD domain-containing protein
MKRLLTIAMLAIAMMLIPTGASAARISGADHGGAPFSVTLAPSVSDSSGSGSATLTINPGLEEVCWAIHVSGLTTPVIASHIHKIVSNGNGPVVVPFFNLTTPSIATEFVGCARNNAINISGSERALLQAIIADPGGYYVNVHTTEHPGGEVRGGLVGP